MVGYDWLYKLPVSHESEPGWFKLKWRPIKNGTYNLYGHWTYKSYHAFGLGFRVWGSGAHNGWGRSWDGIHFEFTILIAHIDFWILWNINVMEEGPSDIDEKDKRPLNVPDSARRYNTKEARLKWLKDHGYKNDGSMISKVE